MSGCCGPTRRTLLRSGLVLGATASLLPARARADARAIVPADLELVTLAEDHAVLTWFTGYAGTRDEHGRMVPAPSDGEIAYGTRPDRLDQVAHGFAGTAYHHVELTGLEPGRTYYYQARSAGRPATAAVLPGGNAAGTGLVAAGTGPFCFTTPQPPPGDFLFSVALCNDIHIGERIAGLVGGIDAIRGVEQLPGRPPYAELMAEAVVRESRERGAHHLLAAGDITAEAEPQDVSRAKAIMDGFGSQGRDYFIARGNHDRAHAGAAHASCGPGRHQGNDCFADGFFPDRTTWFSEQLRGLRVLGLDTYDKPGDGGDAGGLSAEQFAWLREELAAEPDQPTLVFGHHPLIPVANPSAVSGGTTLEPGQALRVVELYRDAPGVFLHHAGHTHRNQRAVLPGTEGRVVQQEVAATKEYPGGYAMLRVHTGGYAVNFYKTRSDLAREWSERSRMELGGLWPQLSFGHHVSDRNFVREADFSGLRR